MQLPQNPQITGFHISIIRHAAQEEHQMQEKSPCCPCNALPGHCCCSHTKHASLNSHFWALSSKFFQEGFVSSCQILVDLPPNSEHTTRSTRSAASARGWVAMHLYRWFFLNRRLCCSFRPVLKGKPLCSISVHFYIPLFLAGMCFRPRVAPVPAASQSSGGTRAILSRLFPWKHQNPFLNMWPKFKRKGKNKIKNRGGNCSDRRRKKEDWHKELEPHVPDELSDWQNKTSTKSGDDRRAEEIWDEIPHS